jgi:hypothetical protein
LQIAILRVIGVEHCVCDIGYVVSGIRFPRNIDLLTANFEGIGELLKKSEKLCSNIFLAGCGGCPLGKSSADELLNPGCVGRVDPRPWVLDWLEGAVLPEKRPVFLEKSFETATARTPSSQIVISSRS